MQSRLEVTWFTHDHEHRNYWLRFGLMESHASRNLIYREQPYHEAKAHGFFDTGDRSPQKAVSLILVKDGNRKTRCVVESEDSFLLISDALRDCDIYFCSGYNAPYLKDQRLPGPLPWQVPADYSKYARLAAQRAEQLGDYFPRVVPFVPIGPEIGWSELPRWKNKLYNLRHRVAALIGHVDWASSLERSRLRYMELKGMRGHPVESDVVLLDSLWGWPRHRVALHQRLATLSARGRAINSRLQWSPAGEYDNPDYPHPHAADFPMAVGRVEQYEYMLARSRLAVFATGFHYGWRNIMTLAMMIGIPILSDRSLIQPWFGLDKFRIFWNETSDWSSVDQRLSAITPELRDSIRIHNCEAADRYLSPNAIAIYFLKTAMRESLPTRAEAI